MNAGLDPGNRCMLNCGRGGGNNQTSVHPTLCSRCSRLHCARYASAFWAEDLQIIESFDDQ